MAFELSGMGLPLEEINPVRQMLYLHEQKKYSGWQEGSEARRMSVWLLGEPLQEEEEDVTDGMDEMEGVNHREWLEEVD